VTTYLLHDDAFHSPELRHEVAEAVVDPITFIEHEGTRIVVGSELEAPIFEKREDVVDEFWSAHQLGIDELVKDRSLPVELMQSELVARALQKVDARKVSVPPNFQLVVADYLRDRGIEVVVDSEAWALRRRRKSPWELEGIERAQRAAETAMLAAARMLGEAEVTREGRLRFEGEILTADLIRLAMSAELLTQGAESEDVIVHSGDACFGGHDPGAGPILPDRPCIVDCFPRDRRSGAHTDMTRTFVPGAISDDVKKMHRHVRTALDIAFESLMPGRDDAYTRVAEYFHEHGIPTQLSHTGDGALREGFSHSLGHGVGLEIHERPHVGRRSEELVEGDVVAVEPGLYFEGIGGVRLEDTVIVTPEGVEHFTDPYPYDLELVGA
jgi:Xaa-Pro aminopeptidase